MTRAALQADTLADTPYHDPPLDGWTILLVGALMTIGTAIVYSASVSVDGELLGRRWWATPARQGVFALLGFVAMVICAHVDYRWFAWRDDRTRWRSTALLVVAAMLLVAMLIPGIGSNELGAQRSITVLRSPLRLGFQPAEIAKVVLVVWLAAFLTRRGGEPRSWWGTFVPALGAAGVLVVLTGKEDFGTAALIGLMAMCMLFLAGARLTHLSLATVLGAAGGLVLLLSREYRWKRIATFFSDAPDPQDEGYQIHQSLIAIASGSWWGRGLGAGVQKYDYLPQDTSDFVLAVLCEEMGIAGGLVVVMLFIALLWRGWWIARNAETSFGRLLAAGITLVICLQAAFNIAVVTRSVPTKGISLPFISAGGSGVLFLGCAAGLLAAVGRRRAGAQGRFT
jgi:cell division protein FtsW